MPATATDRLSGLSTSVAVKAPCKAYTSVALTQFGEQTIGGVACVDGDRYLRNVSPADSSNGIWVVRETSHERAKDFDGARDVVQGTIVIVATAASNATIYRVTTENPIVIGTTAIEFVAAGVDDIANLLYTQAGVGAVPLAAQDKMREWFSVFDFGIEADGSDQTAELLAMATANPGRTFLVPRGVLFNRKTLITSLPTSIVLLDYSAINDFSSAGETTKHVGIMSSDEAVSDTHWSVDSGHHSVIATNNYGTAGSTSASERKASWIWNVGQYSLGAADKRGFRGAAIAQFTKDSGASYWTWGIRSLAPWLAIAGEYEEWAAGQTIGGADVYRTWNAQHYKSTGAGVTGATPPTHTTGTVSDGAVSWTWVDSADRSVFQFNEYGQVQIGGGSFSPTWRHKVSAVNPNGNYSSECEATGISKVAQLKLIPTDAAGVASPQPFWRAQDGLGLRLMKSDASSALMTFSDSGGTLAGELCGVFTTATNLDTTPTVEGVNVLYLANAGATSVTTLDDGTDGQVVELHFGTGNTTLVNSANFVLQGSVNVTPTANSVVLMRRWPTAITANRWVEVSRSIK